MINEAPIELAVINSFIIVLILIDAFIRIGARKSNNSDSG